MTYPAYGLTGIWVLEMFVLAGVHANDIRRLLNNLAPGAPLAGGV